MTPVDFPEANVTFGPPPDLAESQCMRIRAWQGTIARGSVEGAAVVVTAWRPDAAELAALNAGQPLFLSFLGGLPPHFPTVSFKEAVSPA